ncbi:phosphodiester glycosidase family protein [Clostridium butyricum]|uniref:Phosphodiester glycosidase domain-containing protein n=1 Tax=Clostridium butyricum TaxID=1492 RepID=A0A512TS96_CLOBU|nr:phosphodiester glycosidase family protein [Clostridium butyricum]ETI90072.1 MAG: hypothetical protein Q607_CBUC00063G0006 [Clostridium butyricum DORA_1]MDU1006746.1 phosphodiester glycosidase family protein [Clostridium butyricum]MDU1509904.1 phosphodiester glycosidase family protein [Clostridium butyricum]MDU4752804.1 phosphodiester glycosidase family protein [Clostridium butyricum]MDU4802742.1 phosphodiester glycosidase family protein [Clostridium butyricum]
MVNSKEILKKLVRFYAKSTSLSKMISPNNFVFVVVDGRDNGYSRGMTLNEFSQLFEDLGCTYAYNLDGGGSSTMYFNGRVVNNPGGKDSERKVSDIIYIN